MAVSALPAVIDALVSLAAGVVPADVLVSDALPASADPSDFLAVGIESLDAESSSRAVESRQSFAEIGMGSRDEDGVVHCVAAARTQDETTKDARDRAFAIAEAVAGLCRSNPSLGIPTLLWASYGVETGASPLYESGLATAYFVEFQIAYRARI